MVLRLSPLASSGLPSSAGGLSLFQSKSMTDELTRCINEIMRMRKDVMEMAGEYRGYTQTHRK